MDAKAEGMVSEKVPMPGSGGNTFRKCTHCRGEGVYAPIRHIVQGGGKTKIEKPSRHDNIFKLIQ